MNEFAKNLVLRRIGQKVPNIPTPTNSQPEPNPLVPVIHSQQTNKIVPFIPNARKTIHDIFVRVPKGDMDAVRQAWSSCVTAQYKHQEANNPLDPTEVVITALETKGAEVIRQELDIPNILEMGEKIIKFNPNQNVFSDTLHMQGATLHLERGKNSDPYKLKIIRLIDSDSPLVNLGPVETLQIAERVKSQEEENSSELPQAA